MREALQLAPAAAGCASCGLELAPSLLSCPRCHRLVHARQLRQLADEASAALAAQNPPAALAAWRCALELLPAGSRQHASVLQRLDEVARIAEAAPRGAAPSPPAGAAGSTSWRKRGAAALGTLALLLWKAKALLLLALTKGKLLLLGFTKLTTLASMLLSFGVYWQIWGWPFALGLVASIYVHEMGHVAALNRLGFKASPPAFIPGVGAVVRMKQHPASPVEDARVGLAGPLWGLGAALVAAAAFAAGGWAICGAIARVGAWINLFNLLPLMPLDGGRGFRALSRPQRWMAVAAIAAAWAVSREGLLVLLLLVGIGAAAAKPAGDGDTRALYHYAGLIAALTALTMIPVAAV